MPVSFLYPQALVLLLLAPLIWRFLTCGRLVPSAVLRMAVFCLAVTALAGPRMEREDGGVDIIILADRSDSCAVRAGATLRELLPLMRTSAGPGDRLAVIAFGNGALVEKGFRSDASAAIEPDGFSSASDLASALRLASELRDPARRTAVLYVGDGQYTGESPALPASLARLGRLPFWYRRVSRPAGLEVAAGDIRVPGQVHPNSAWVVGFSLYASASSSAGYRLERNGVAIARGDVELTRGDNHFFVRDSIADGDLLSYRLTVRADGDTIAENNVAAAIATVRAAPGVLLVSHLGEKGFLAGAFEAASISTDVIPPERFPDAPALLAPYKLVVLENTPVTAIPSSGANALAAAVRGGLCSLLVTGGANSFGMGGYHRSVLDPLLPVEMELRNDIRRGAMAVAMALDRSGSMAVPAGEGRTKMDLANLGAAESIRLLAPSDQVSVIAVDSQAHVIVPLALADNVEELARQTMTIQSMGGGIFCRTALQAAAREVEKSDLRNRHIILFADAADAEEQEGCLELVRGLRAKRIGVSVVAMGTRDDSDADFLIRLAEAGDGQALFSEEASGLPALFTQEIMRVSRRGFIEEPATPELLPPLSLLGVRAAAAPTIGGHNVSAARDGAEVFMRLPDEFGTPLMAWKRLGRTATGALLFEVEGEFAGNFTRWPPAPEMLVSFARRLVPGETAAGVKPYVSSGGGVATVDLEFSPEAADGAAVSGVREMRWLGPGGAEFSSPLEWVESDRATARLRMDVPGHYLAVADFPGLGMVAAPPVSLAYGAEYKPLDAVGEERLLARLAEAGGGGDALDLRRVGASAVALERGRRDVFPHLVVAIALLLLLELSGRRLQWFS